LEIGLRSQAVTVIINSAKRKRKQASRIDGRPRPTPERRKQMKRKLCIGSAILSVFLVINAFPQGGEKKTTAARAKPLACIIDLDGTIADESARREAAAGEDGKLQGKEWDAYFDTSKVPGDKPLPTGRETLHWLDGQGITIFYVSSRPATMLEASKTWLKVNGFPPGEDVLHKEDKYEKSLKYKTRVIEDIKAGGYNVLFGVGDRDKDIQSYEAAGIIGIKLEPNKDEEWKRARREIEEILKKQAATK